MFLSVQIAMLPPKEAAERFEDAPYAWAYARPNAWERIAAGVSIRPLNQVMSRVSVNSHRLQLLREE